MDDDPLNTMTDDELRAAVLGQQAPEQPAEVAETDEEVVTAAGHNYDELAAWLQERPDLNETLGEPTTEEELLRNVELVARMKQTEERAAEASSLAANRALERAYDAYNSAIDESDVLEALAGLATDVGLADPRMAQFLSELGPLDQGVASRWLQDVDRRAAESQAFNAQLGALHAQARANERAEIEAKAIHEAIESVAEQYGEDFERLKPEVAAFLETVEVESLDDARRLVELGVRTAKEAERQDAVADFRHQFLETALATTNEYRNPEGDLVIPDTRRSIDVGEFARRAAPPASRADAVAAFREQFEAATTSPSAGFREEVDRLAVAAEQRQKERDE
jgi:hypothetical protein